MLLFLSSQRVHRIPIRTEGPVCILQGWLPVILSFRLSPFLFALPTIHSLFIPFFLPFLSFLPYSPPRC
ncbi:hypothetical protein BO85DRAFT_272798 [Aspergillus piperis CBS 112811]|uniref:Uncharacterized protein n=2 Tax=Aspergillus subgen. Circumdati TaxID=2720871 RepID=A0A8G1VM75_9EURO|nr:hypothetical protein BO85DRAFT_272798 [Aspergillus piperis CBS 112811]OJZ92621.1 hypothetical protein ASPFODRAFT_269545 [Aspergillus luchuensis CBS 106.47]RAH58341.1 hypothetical protein BO85DRAFT_272798 [Aspergillus piperis CBS 112811]